MKFQRYITLATSKNNINIESADYYVYILCIAVVISGNRPFQLGDTNNSTPVPVQSIQWVDEFNTVVRNGVSVKGLVVDIVITTSSNNTIRCG